MKFADGILTTPREKAGKSLKPQAKKAVLDFSENDEYFQQMPGKNNNVSISLETHKQKSLLLCNFKELYQEFRVKNPTIGIGFSKFASLCPKWYVAIGASGTHSVCVCSIHQNAILLCSASGLKVTYKDLINMIVYNSQNKHCMKHCCHECQGKDNL